MKHANSLRWAALLVVASSLPASALNIVLTNDDGFETSNIQSLFNALRAAGHDVILSAPYGNQSGTSGQVAFLTPITPTTSASKGGTIPAGSPGVGPTTIAPNQYYVSGSPCAAVLYGIDVVAKQKWGHAPDLVISGPNEGNNVGLLTTHSGTVGAAMTAINKGIPSIAVSGYAGSAATTPAESAAYAALTVKLVGSLDTKQGSLLPIGTGINVNLPKIDGSKPLDSFDYVMTRVGVAAPYGLHFYSTLGDNPTAKLALPAGALGFPGVALDSPISAAGYPEDNSALSENNALEPGVVTLSPIQGTCEADAVENVLVRQSLHSLFKPAQAGPKR